MKERRQADRRDRLTITVKDRRVPILNERTKNSIREMALNNLIDKLIRK